MKKFFSVLAIAVALLTAGNAQAQKMVFDKGDQIASLTVGYGSGFGQRVVYEKSVMTLLDGKASIGVGGAFNNAIKTYNYSNSLGYKYFYDYFTLGAVGSFHYQFIDKLDTYVHIGLGGGAYVWKTNWNDGDSTSTTHGVFDWTTTFGARWYFNDNWAVNAELGWVASSYLMVGATYKF